MKGKSFYDLRGHVWMCDLILTDVTEHMNELNMNIRGVNHFTEIFDKRTVFERKLWLWELHLGSVCHP